MSSCRLPKTGIPSALLAGYQMNCCAASRAASLAYLEASSPYVDDYLNDVGKGETSFDPRSGVRLFV